MSAFLKCFLMLFKNYPRCDHKISILWYISISKAFNQPHEPLGALWPTFVFIYAHHDLSSLCSFVLSIVPCAVPCSELQAVGSLGRDSFLWIYYTSHNKEQVLYVASWLYHNINNIFSLYWHNSFEPKEESQKAAVKKQRFHHFEII